MEGCILSRLSGETRRAVNVQLFAVLWFSFAAQGATGAGGVYPSTYKPASAPATVVTGATVLVGDGTRYEGDVFFADGRFVRGGEVERRIAATGKWVTPGIIDVHSHMGNGASPRYSAHADVNESSDPVTAEVWVEHGVWPQDPQFPLALAGGVTTFQILPGSANLFGGRSVVVKNVSARTVQEMKFPGAPYGLKMACGENPKRVYGGKGKAPKTRMGNVAGYRKAWIDAVAYQEKWQTWHSTLAECEQGGAKEGDRKPPPVAPKRDLQMETLAGVLAGEIRVHNHFYRADEMAIMLDVAREFGYKIAAFHHAVEAYKVADLLREEGVCSAMWADWWRFKMESFDGIAANAALVDAAGACAIIHSDSAQDIQRLNQEAAKALAAGREAGLAIDEAQAIRWITENPAIALGLEDQVGTITPGKMADLVIWDTNPFSVYARAEQVFIDGVLVYDRHRGVVPVTDFELGQRELGDVPTRTRGLREPRS